MGKISLERPKLKWEDYVKKDVKKMERYSRKHEQVARFLFSYWSLRPKPRKKKREEKKL